MAHFTSDPTLTLHEDTFLLPFHHDVPIVGAVVIQPMVIRGKEPVLVDTGVKWVREAYLERAFSLVDPEDVRWVFLSHDDRDHAANVLPVLEACPHAKLVTTFTALGRLMDEIEVPMHRIVFRNDGEPFDAGDRTLIPLRPPLFDGPATRGLFDSRSRLYYGVDSFGAFLPSYRPTEREARPEDYEHGFAFWNRNNHSWHVYVDLARIRNVVRAIERHRPEAIVSYHGPLIEDVERAFERIIDTIGMGPVEEITQADLERLMASGPPPKSEGAPSD